MQKFKLRKQRYALKRKSENICSPFLSALHHIFPYLCYYEKPLSYLHARFNCERAADRPLLLQRIAIAPAGSFKYIYPERNNGSLLGNIHTDYCRNIVCCTEHRANAKSKVFCLLYNAAFRSNHALCVSKNYFHFISRNGGLGVFLHVLIFKILFRKRRHFIHRRNHQPQIIFNADRRGTRSHSFRFHRLRNF